MPGCDCCQAYPHPIVVKPTPISPQLSSLPPGSGYCCQAYPHYLGGFLLSFFNNDNEYEWSGLFTSCKRFLEINLGAQALSHLHC